MDRYFCRFLSKWKVEPGKYPCVGYTPPRHFWEDVKLGLRHFRMMIGKPPENSSPGVQQDEGLNKDETLYYKQ